MTMISIAQAQLKQPPNPKLITTPYEVNLKGLASDINLTYYTLDGKGNRITVPFDVSYENPDKFGFVFTKTTIENELKNGNEIFDNKIYYDIQSDETYIQSANPFMLERPLGYQKEVTNQLGQKEQREVNRYIDFSQIMKKENNLYEEVTTDELVSVCNDFGMDCNSTIQPITRKQERNYTFSFIQNAKDWIIEFTNLFDLDPSFIDDTDTNWNAGTFLRMNTSGTGVDANLTSTGRNVSGFYASQIFDAGDVANWTNFSTRVDANYGIEIGRAFNDTKDAVLPYINTSGLVGLWHFNNETGENDSLFKDYSTEVNSERANEQQNNGTCFNCPIYNSTSMLGKYAITFQSKSPVKNFINLSRPYALNSTGNITWTAWVKQSPLNPPTAYILAQHKSSAGSPDNFIRIQSALGIRCMMGGHVVTVATNMLNQNQWQFYVCRYNGTFVAGFMDGVDIGSIAKTGASNYSDTDWVIGSSSGVNIGSSSQLNGSIDEISMWNRSLSKDEITTLYRRGAMRLNVSVRSCDDSNCAGESYTQLQNATMGNGGYFTNVTVPNNRYFQYNLTYSNNATTGNIIIQNVSVNYFIPSNLYANITAVDMFDRVDSSTLSSSQSINDTSNYSTQWTEYEYGTTAFSINSNKWRAVYTVDGIGSKTAINISPNVLFMNKNMSGLCINGLTGVVATESLSLIKFNSTDSIPIYQLNVTGNAITGDDFKDSKGSITTGVAEPINICFNFTSDGISGYDNVTMKINANQFIRPVNNFGRNITSLEIGELTNGVIGTVDIDSIANVTNGTNALNSGVVTDDCTYTSGDWIIDDGSICVCTSQIGVYPNNFALLNGGLLMETGCDIRAKQCFKADNQILYRRDGVIGLNCGE